MWNRASPSDWPPEMLGQPGQRGVHPQRAKEFHHAQGLGEDAGVRVRNAPALRARYDRECKHDDDRSYFCSRDESLEPGGRTELVENAGCHRKQHGGGRKKARGENAPAVGIAKDPAHPGTGRPLSRGTIDPVKRGLFFSPPEESEWNVPSAGTWA